MVANTPDDGAEEGGPEEGGAVAQAARIIAVTAAPANRMFRVSFIAHIFDDRI